MVVLALMLVLFLVGGVVFPLSLSLSLSLLSLSLLSLLSLSLFSLSLFSLFSLFLLLPQDEWKNARRGKVD
jgi:hypothetical protein